MSLLKATQRAGYFEIDKPVRFRKNVLFDAEYPLGKTLYVRNNGSDGNAANGETVASAFKTLAHAVSHASDFDRIIILPATDMSAYLETELPINITQTGLKILGMQTSHGQWGSPAIHSHGTTTILQIKAHMVELANFSLHHQGAGVSVEVGVDNNYWRTHIHDMFFGGNSAALWAIVLSNYNGSGIGAGATVEAPCSMIERCTFYEYVNGVYFSGGMNQLRNCLFTGGPAGSYYDVLVPDTSTSRSNKVILDNRFQSLDPTNRVAIQISNTPSAGALFIDGNSFNNYADTAHCMSKHDGYLGANYANGVLITT